MVVIQYPDKLTWKTNPTIEENEFNQPIEVGGDIVEIEGRYENFLKGGFKEYPKEDGTSVLADGVFYARIGQQLPKRYDIIEIESRGLKSQILHVYKGQLNTTIYLKELK